MEQTIAACRRKEIIMLHNDNRFYLRLTCIKWCVSKLIIVDQLLLEQFLDNPERNLKSKYVYLFSYRHIIVHMFSFLIWNVWHKKYIYIIIILSYLLLGLIFSRLCPIQLSKLSLLIQEPCFLQHQIFQGASYYRSTRMRSVLLKLKKWI